MFERYQRRVSLIMALSDVVFINLAFAAAYWVRYDLQWLRAVDPAYDAPYSAYVPFAVVLTALLLIIYKFGGVYDQRRGASWFDEFYAIVSGTTIGIVVMIVATLFYQPLLPSRLIFLYAAILISAILGLSRWVKNIFLGHLRKRGTGVDRVLIVGAGEVGRFDEPGEGAALLAERCLTGSPATSRRHLYQAVTRFVALVYHRAMHLAPLSNLMLATD